RPTFHRSQKVAHVLDRKNGRKPPRTFGPDDVFEPRQLRAENLAIQEQDRRQGLVLRARGNLALDGERAEESLDLDRAHLARMTPVVGENEPPYPSQVHPFRVETVVFEPQSPANLVEKARRP